MKKRLIRALMRASRSVDKGSTIIETLVEMEQIDPALASVIMLELEDARREMTQCARQLSDAADQLTQFSQTAAEMAQTAFYYNRLNDAEKGEIYLEARANGFHSSDDYIRHKLTIDNC